MGTFRSRRTTPPPSRALPTRTWRPLSLSRPRRRSFIHSPEIYSDGRRRHPRHSWPPRCAGRRQERYRRRAGRNHPGWRTIPCQFWDFEQSPRGCLTLAIPEPGEGGGNFGKPDLCASNGPNPIINCRTSGQEVVGCYENDRNCNYNQQILQIGPRKRAPSELFPHLFPRASPLHQLQHIRSLTHSAPSLNEKSRPGARNRVRSDDIPPDWGDVPPNPHRGLFGPVFPVQRQPAHFQCGTAHEFRAGTFTRSPTNEPPFLHREADRVRMLEFRLGLRFWSWF